MHCIFFSSYAFRHRLALIVFAALLTASAVSGRGWLGSFNGIAQSSELQPVNVAQSDTHRDRVEAEVITLLATGFQPSEITRPRGQFLILVDNRSDFDDLNLMLVSVNGQKLRELKMKKEDRTVKQLEDLPPGEYLLTEADHADWVCRINITPR